MGSGALAPGPRSLLGSKRLICRAEDEELEGVVLRDAGFATHVCNPLFIVLQRVEVEDNEELALHFFWFDDKVVGELSRRNRIPKDPRIFLKDVDEVRLEHSHGGKFVVVV